MSFRITLQDLGMAYRKAKVDLYYMGNPCLLQLQQYEENLRQNLESLLEKIQGEDGHWFEDSEFLGEWSIIPKSISNLKENGGAVFSSSEEKWQHLSRGEKPQAEFRLIAKPSIDFLVFSTLWMIKVGSKYDAKLTDCAYGNRLRRTQEGELNPLSLGSFVPYQKPFREWRDNGINVMRAALDKKISVVAITADVNSFYHELAPDFLLKKEFLNKINLELNQEELEFTEQFIKMLEKWAEQTPLKKGIPVGLPASALIANMALIELDQLIQKEIVPLYYGRYVDDLILVMANNSSFNSTKQVWEWFFARTKKRLLWSNETTEDSVSFEPGYLDKSKVLFSNKKNKLFFLKGENGAALIESLSKQISERASEWRAMPSLPDNPKHIATEIITASEHEEDVADNLRKADSLSMRRSNFAIKLRDFEAYARDLPPDAWKQSRKVFLDVFIKHTITLPIFFDMAKYLPRVIRLATACEDFDELKQIVNQLDSVIRTLKKDCEISLKSCDDKLCPDSVELINVWKKQITQIIDENIKASFPTQLTQEGKKRWQDNFSKFTLFSFPLDTKDNQSWQVKLFSHDLAYIPFRYIGLPVELTRKRGIPTKKSLTYCKDADLLVIKSVSSGLKSLSSQIVKCKASELPYGLMFATRPFNLTELFLLHKAPYIEKNSEELVENILALRGFDIKGKIPKQRQRSGVLEINTHFNKSNLNIAVASWKTDIRSWTASVTKSRDPDESRYHRLNRLLNSVMQSPININYLILPELSLPAHWFLSFAQKLHGRGIALITGVEYLHRKNKKVTNQIWAALSHDGLGFSSILVFRQDKQKPALHEERELHRLAGIQLSAIRSWNIPPVIRHGNFQFSMLNCSELTNIAYRNALRGKVDALFVPEWNQDTESFNALVESAALDIHAYIIQCNDRQYGDSRIRAPYKDSWKRDIVRLKGGEHDYFVVGNIDVTALRKFQSSYRSAAGPFKPMPDGFNNNMAHERKMLPESE